MEPLKKDSTPVPGSINQNQEIKPKLKPEQDAATPIPKLAESTKKSIHEGPPKSEAQIFFEAIQRKDSKKVEQMLIAGTNPNIKYGGSPAIYEAALSTKDPEITKLLIKYNANVNATLEGYNYEGCRTTLDHVLLDLSPEAIPIAEILLRNKAKINKFALSSPSTTNLELLDTVVSSDAFFNLPENERKRQINCLPNNHTIRRLQENMQTIFKEKPEYSAPIAARLGLRKLTKALIKKGAPLNSYYQFPSHLSFIAPSNEDYWERGVGKTLLMLAIEHNHNELAKDLISLAQKKELDATEQNTRGRTALMMAIEQANFELVKVLLKAGANPNMKTGNEWERTTLSSCCSERLAKSNIMPILDELIKYKVNINDRDSLTGQTALMKAATSKSMIAIFDKLLHNGANADYVALEQVSPSYGMFKNRPIPKLGNTSQDGVTALILAARHKNAAALDRLIDIGVNLEVRDYRGNTALLNSILKGDLESTEKLIAAVADLHITNKKGLSPFAIALKRGNFEMAQLVSSYNCDLYDSIDLLKEAILTGQKSFVEFLLKKDLKQILMGKDTPLHLSIRGKHEDISELLINDGTPLDEANEEGNTPLIEAVKVSSYNTIDKLLQVSVNVNHKNNLGNTALIEAAKIGDIESIRKLQGAKAELNTQNKNGENALMVAIESGKPKEFIQQLIDRGIDLTAKNKNNETVLEIALRERRYDLQELLFPKTSKGNENKKEVEKLVRDALFRLKSIELEDFKELVSSYKDDFKEVINRTKTPMTFLRDNPTNCKKINFLIQEGVLLNQTDSVGRSILDYLASEDNQTENLKLLLSKDIDINQADDYGNTALIRAAHNSLNNTRLLLEHKANIDIQNKEGRTALMDRIHYLSEPFYGEDHNNKFKVVNFLIESGTNLDLKDKQGQTVLEIANNKKRSSSLVSDILKKGLSKQIKLPPNVNLERMDLSNIEINGAQFQKTNNVENTNFEGSTFRNVDLSQLGFWNLRKANFQGAKYDPKTTIFPYFFKAASYGMTPINS